MIKEKETKVKETVKEKNTLLMSINQDTERIKPLFLPCFLLVTGIISFCTNN
jgi:hypothetical protein